jgi:hypothetical protein
MPQRIRVLSEVWPLIWLDRQRKLSLRCVDIDALVTLFEPLKTRFELQLFL